MRAAGAALTRLDVRQVGVDALAFQRQVLLLLPAFWDDRDVGHLHHPVWFRQLGATALAARDETGALIGYLLGAPTPHGGYAHVVATLPAVRGQGAGRALYARFAAAITSDAPATVEAITMPTNTGSIAFHRRLGFTAELVEDYAGPGEDRVHFGVDAATLLDG